jgi:hypothetical protein
MHFIVFELAAIDSAIRKPHLAMVSHVVEPRAREG